MRTVPIMIQMVIMFCGFYAFKELLFVAYYNALLVIFFGVKFGDNLY